MKKLKMARGTLLTFEEGCNKYLENCRQRNLREGTINHYRQSYLDTSFTETSKRDIMFSGNTQTMYSSKRCLLFSLRRDIMRCEM